MSLFDDEDYRRLLASAIDVVTDLEGDCGSSEDEVDFDYESDFAEARSALETVKRKLPAWTAPREQIQ